LRTQKTWQIFAALNVGLVLGISASLFMVPGNTPFWLWAAISGCFIMAANYLLFARLRKTSEPESTKDTKLSPVLAWVGVLIFLLDLVLRLIQHSH